MKKILLTLTVALPLITFAQCKGITSKTDDFTGEKTLMTPTMSNLVLVKSIKEKDTTYTLCLQVPNSQMAIGKGAYVLFSDGSKWMKDFEEVDSQVITSYYVYYAKIQLTPDELEEISTKRIKKMKLHIFEADVTEKIGNWFLQEVACMKQL